MNRSQDPGIRTRWAAALRAGRRPRLVAAACAVVLAALPSIGIFQNPAGVCERHAPDSSPCTVG